MKKIFLQTIATLLFICSVQAVATAQAQHQLVKLWETDSVFKVPESVLFDAKNNALYVANIDGTDPWAKDGKGSIGKMGADGKSVKAEWVSGLNAPKGMGLHNGKLYVADLTDIAVIDVASGKIDKRIPVTDAQGLNDVSVDADGVIYVSDSRAKKIYKVKDGSTELFVDNLKGPNGVLMRGKDFYILDAGGVYKMNADKSLTKVVDGMEGGTDGIENVQGNDFIVSCWGGTLYYVNADGTKQLLMDTRPQKANSADIGYDPKAKTVFVPTFWKNSVIAYQVK
jgi:DNA-binding beta-propeller fold protein YncE